MKKRFQKIAQHLENVKTLQGLSTRELTRAIRDAIIAEEGAINQYETIVDSTEHDGAKEVLQEIADEEKVHVGELQQLLRGLLPDEQDFLDEGADEVDSGEPVEANIKKAAVSREYQKEIDELAEEMQGRLFAKIHEEVRELAYDFEERRLGVSGDGSLVNAYYKTVLEKLSKRVASESRNRQASEPEMIFSRSEGPRVATRRGRM